MNEKKSFAEKFIALCDSGRPWYVFLGLFSMLLVCSLLLERFTDQHMKWWAWVLNIVGILDSLRNIWYCKKRKTEKADAA